MTPVTLTMQDRQTLDVISRLDHGVLTPREAAELLGYSVRLWNVFFFALLGLAIAFAVRIVGLLVVFSYLVMPGVAGLCLAKRMRGAFLASLGIAVVASLLGVYASWVFDLPTGPANVVALAILTAVAALLGRLLRRA